jgi:hypothetical protein
LTKSQFFFINGNLNFNQPLDNIRLQPPQEEEILRNKHKGITAVLMSLALLPVITAAQTENAAELSNIEVNPLENNLEVKLDVPTPVNYESFSLFNPNRLVIDLLSIENFSCSPEIIVNDFGVLQIRTAKNQPDVIRVVFDLEETAPAYTVEEKEDGIYIYFEPVEMPVLEETAAEEPGKKETEEEVIPPPEVEKKAEEPAEEKKTLPEIQKPADMTTASRSNVLSVAAVGGAYMVQDSNFQDVYGQSTVSFGGDITYFFPLSTVENIGVSLDLRLIAVTGQTTYTQEDVELNLIPFSVSLVYQRIFGKAGPYAGLGLDYINYKETYPDTFLISEMSGSALGYHFVIGTTVNFIKSLGAKAFFKLHSAKKTINEMDVNLGGTEFGLGLFYTFNF